MSKADELRKLIQENPDLPLVFCCGTDELEDGYLTFYEDFSCDVVTIYKTDEKVFDHIIDIEEYYQELYETDEDIQKAIQKTPQYKAIRIICN